MLRRMTISIFGGALLAVALAFSQTATAACDGRCADTAPNGGVFDSCAITFTCPPQMECYESGTTCFYTSEPIIT